MTSEHDLLLQLLRGQRRHVLGAVEGLSAEQLRRPVLPSAWHCLGLIKHLALAHEHYWFRCVIGGEPFGLVTAAPGTEWQVDDGEDVLALYRDETDRADAIIASTPLEAPPRQADPRWAQWGREFPDLRYILLHVITETATHAGHLDAARELIDGRQWIVI